MGTGSSAGDPQNFDASGNLLTTGPTGTSSQTVQGVAANGTAAASAGNPLVVGGVAVSAGTVTANGLSARFTMDLNYALLTKPYAVSGADWQYAAAANGIVNTTTAVTFKAAAGASTRNYVTGLQIMAEALGAATEVAIRDGAAGPVLWRTKIGTGGLVNGLSVSFNTPLRGSNNTLLEVVTLTASVTGAVYFNAQGYAAP